MDRIIVFSSPYFLRRSSPPSSLINDRGHVAAWPTVDRLGGRHVSADFPIKPAQRVSIDANQRLLSACPPILDLFTIALDRATSRTYRLSLRREKLNARAFDDLVRVSSFFFFLLSRFPLMLFLDRLTIEKKLS